MASDGDDQNDDETDDDGKEPALVLSQTKAVERCLGPSGLDPSCRSPLSSDHCFGSRVGSRTRTRRRSHAKPQRCGKDSSDIGISRLAALADLSGLRRSGRRGFVRARRAADSRIRCCGGVPGDPAPFATGRRQRSIRRSLRRIRRRRVVRGRRSTGLRWPCRLRSVAAPSGGTGESTLPRMIGRPSLPEPMTTIFAFWRQREFKRRLDAAPAQIRFGNSLADRVLEGGYAVGLDLFAL